jgi:putative ABC transport system ATP-binding protein
MAEVVTKLASETLKTTRDECAVISLDGVSREYTGRTGVIRALDSATFSIVAGEWVAITGPSGSGKSTLVNLLGCLDRPTCGTLKIDGTDVAAMSAKELDRFRADKIGFIFQQFHLIPYLTALENVMLAQYFHSMTDEQEARAALEKVRLGDRLTHLPSELSGGEQQRVCIARALINNPPILLADEPTGNLDLANQKIVAGLLKDLHAAGHTIVMVTHDPEMAALAQRKIALSHGRVFCHPIATIVKLR